MTVILLTEIEVPFSSKVKKNLKKVNLFMNCKKDEVIKYKQIERSPQLFGSRHYEYSFIAIRRLIKVSVNIDKTIRKKQTLIKTQSTITSRPHILQKCSTN